eukprot:140957_1
MADLQQFLDQYKLSSYAEALAEYGAESIDDLLDLDDDELEEAADECNMKKLDKKKFIKGIDELKSGGGSNPLVKCSIKELSKENINSYRCKMGALEFKMGGDTISAND